MRDDMPDSDDEEKSAVRAARSSPDSTGSLVGKHEPSGDCSNKTEQVVQDAKDALEEGDVARAFHYIARFGDRGVGNYHTEDLLHEEIDDVLGDESEEVDR